MAFVCKCQDNQWIVSALIRKHDGIEQQHHFRNAIRNAINSITNHRAVINVFDAIDFKKIKYVGPKIVELVQECHTNGYQQYIEHGQKYREKAAKSKKKKLVNFWSSSPQFELCIAHEIDEPNDNEEKKDNNNNKRKKKKHKDNQDNNKEMFGYIPRLKTGNWGILYALALDMNQRSLLKTIIAPNDTSQPSYTKAQIIQLAQPFCTASYTALVRGFTAWSNYDKLIDDDLMIQKGNHQDTATFKLTHKGYQLGQKFISDEKERTSQRNDDSNSENKSSVSRSINNRKRKINVLQDITNINNDGLPIKRSKSNLMNPINRIGSIGNLSIIDGLDTKYNLKQPILYKNKRYILHLNVDKREGSGATKSVDIFKDLYKDGTIQVTDYSLASGDFMWLLINMDKPQDAKERLVLPFIIERKRWSDFYKSIKSGRYRTQKYVMSWVMENIMDRFDGGRKIYLIERERKDNGVPESELPQCQQAMVNTEARDGYFMYITNYKRETLRTLIGWTYQIRKWIEDELRKDDEMIDKLPRFTLFQDLRKRNLVDLLPHRLNIMKILMQIPGVTEKIAFYITDKYKSIKQLMTAWNKCKMKEWNCNITQKCRNRKTEQWWNFCPWCRASNCGKPELLLFREISIYNEWKYKTDLLREKLCTAELDADVQRCLFALRNDSESNGQEPLSRDLSRKIYKAFTVTEDCDFDQL